MSPPKTADFTLASYRELIDAFIARGYQAVRFANVSPAEPHLILRHDIDFDLEAALAMARIELELGVRSTYFVLLRSAFFNPFSSSSAKALRAIIGLGHDIGLHFDASYHGEAAENLCDSISRECQVLEHLTERRVDIFSFHRPHKSLLAQDYDVDGRIDAYGKRFFSQIGYCSDSRGAWHYGYPLQHAAVTEGRAMQLLTHPNWWTFGDPTPQLKLEALLARRYESLDEAIANNCQNYEPTVSKRLRLEDWEENPR